MVFKKLVSFIYGLILPIGHPRIKDAASSSSYKVMALDASRNVSVKESMLSSPAAPSSSGSAKSSLVEVNVELCCVCLSRMNGGGGEEDMTVLPCLHKFHKVCVDRWFKVVCQKTCPLCRFSMGEEENSQKRQHHHQFTEEMVIWFSSFHVAGF